MCDDIRLCLCFIVFFFKQKTAYEMRISDWSSDVCSSDLAELLNGRVRHGGNPVLRMCAVNAVVTKDPAGNRKLDKSKATGRIDGMVALPMALGVANTATPVLEKKYQMLML